MKPPAEINAELVMPDGSRLRWDAASPKAGDRPLDPQIETATGKGFGAGSVVLQRPTERTYPELGLLNELILRTATGKTVYQGRAQGIPVSDTWQFDCDGWWSHGEQRTMTEVLVDRDLSAWGNESATHRANTLAAGIFRHAHAPTTEWDASGNLTVTLQLGAGEINPSATSYYDAGSGNLIESIYYDYASTNTTSSYVGYLGVSSDDLSTATEFTADLLTGTNSSGTGTFSPTARYRYGALVFVLGGTVGTSSALFRVRKLAVYGDTGIPKIARDEGPSGIAASEAIKYLAGKYAPKWDTSGVQPTSYPIPHAVWREPTTATEAIKQLNSYHLWKLGVWEGRKLTYAPYDLSTADWQVANGQDGVRVEYQGDTTENVFNGCAVSFNDFSGTAQRITPDDTEDLRDDSDWIAANQWGDKAWLDISVSWPCTADDAAQIGSIALASANQARRPSTITVPMHIRDIHGSWWPSSYVRADQTILVTNQHSPVPRLITGTRWANHQLTITTDNAVDTVEAFNARVGGALSANGLI